MKAAFFPFYCSWLAVCSALANPGGLTVRSGSATSQINGSVLTINTSPLAVLTWNTFNINTGETTHFVQPSSDSIVFNIIGDNRPSQILGNLTANGTVILANSQGFYFGPNSFVKVGGDFIATTAPLAPDFGIGSSWQFSGTPPLASIVNYGQISTGRGHSLFLIAENVDNSGTLTAPGGDVGLYAGKEVLVSERADGRGLSATVKLPSGSVNNSGQIVADAGTIALQAQVVNQDGLIQANSVRNDHGVIELFASDQLSLGPNSQILAQGDAVSSGSTGGSVKLESGGSFNDSAGSRIVTTGGAQGGNGGNIEISAPNILSLNSTLDAAAVSGYTAGQFLLDPANITLGTTGSGSAGTGTVGSASGSGNLALNVNTAFANRDFSQIILEATGNITLAAATTWNLSTSTGVRTGALTLEAGGNIIFGNNSKIVDANNWSVNLQAGVNFASGSVQSGTGSIYLSGSSTGTAGGSVQTSAGSITMTAGQDILVGSGFIHTSGGGNIDLQALAGNINAGSGNGGYTFSVLGYAVNPTLGGITTGAGGNMILQAGNDVVSTPTVPAGQTPGASGTYGSQPGNVTVGAGNQILGNFTVANGIGTLLAGVQVQNGQVTQVLEPGADIGSSIHPVNLSLISGSWNLWAAHDIFLAEVRNPSGTFNDNTVSVPSGLFPGNTDNPTVPARSQFLFNYAPNAAASLWAGNAITLTGANLPRLNNENEDMPPIYPPALSLTAGAGGITVNNPIILYPSSQGSLQITTTGNGNLIGAYQQGTLAGITMSDSGLPGYETFAAGHALVPLHLDDPNPVIVNVSGSINSFSLTVPTFAQIAVAGNSYNFVFLGQNLSPSQNTTITVDGTLTYRGDLSTVALPTPLPAALFSPTLSGDPELAGKLLYDATTGVLTFVGQMSASELAFLLNPTEAVLSGGQPVLGANGQPETAPLTLTTAQQAAVQQLYVATQTATLGDSGLALGGPGKFTITAPYIDLGVSGGVSVLPPNSALAAISPYGANLTINDAGSLEMTSSAIANGSLRGSIDLNVGGTLNVGGVLTTLGDPNAPKGIFTTSGGSITVNAQDDINVDSSRIAAYNGGNIDIHSATGDVNAGNGGVGFISMTGVELDPTTGQLISIPATIAGSGILSTTLPGSRGVLGNITVDAPQGSINASAGGIVQIALNGANSANASIDLTAGHDINATDSGIIGGDLRLDAGGKINGILVSTGTINVNSQSSVNVTAFGVGGISISATGSVGGTVISGGIVNVSGGTITASLIAQTVSTTGDATQAAVGVPASSVAKDDTKAADDASTTLAKAGDPSDADDDKKKKAQAITLAQKTGRVTVVLPPKTRSSPSP